MADFLAHRISWMTVYSVTSVFCVGKQRKARKVTFPRPEMELERPESPLKSLLEGWHHYIIFFVTAYMQIEIESYGCKYEIRNKRKGKEKDF